eukprot:scaffold47692_cov30-Tisochrysis_lutea.AAC.4
MLLISALYSVKRALVCTKHWPLSERSTGYKPVASRKLSGRGGLSHTTERPASTTVPHEPALSPTRQRIGPYSTKTPPVRVREACRL